MIQNRYTWINSKNIFAISRIFLGNNICIHVCCTMYLLYVLVRQMGSQTQIHLSMYLSIYVMTNNKVCTSKHFKFFKVSIYYLNYPAGLHISSFIIHKKSWKDPVSHRWSMVSRVLLSTLCNLSEFVMTRRNHILARGLNTFLLIFFFLTFKVRFWQLVVFAKLWAVSTETRL